MATAISSEQPITQTELRKELDRTLAHYATKADIADLPADFAQLELRLTLRLGGLMTALIILATSVIVTLQKVWT